MTPHSPSTTPTRKEENTDTPPRLAGLFFCPNSERHSPSRHRQTPSRPPGGNIPDKMPLFGSVMPKFGNVSLFPAWIRSSATLSFWGIVGLFLGVSLENGNKGRTEARSQHPENSPTPPARAPHTAPQRATTPHGWREDADPSTSGGKCPIIGTPSTPGKVSKIRDTRQTSASKDKGKARAKN